MSRVVPVIAAATMLTFAILAACVGDDPDTTPGGGSSSGTTSSSGTSGGDGSSSSGSTGNGRSSGGSPDAGDAGTTGDATTPFEVRSLGGLKLWLESTKELSAGSSGGTPFGKWADQSGAWDGGGAGAPDGGRHIAEPHDVNPPTIVSNGINGRPTVAFTNGNGHVHIANHADWQFGVGDWIIVEVAKVSAGTGPLWELRPQATAGWEEQFFAGHLCVAYGLGVTNGCTTPAYTPSTDPHVFVARRKGDAFSVRVDGTERSTIVRTGETTNIGVNQFAQPYVFIGKNLDVLVSEVIVVVGPTTDATLATLESHLKAKYAIP